ncbi:unnamed protein product [Rodentolepis nana]|uniref:Fucosyltransferase n=1 Tax=Rodentolepis nana TaxID=102285 RepID=A0A0R3TSS5_RODNA|nr:unnamed protein product [Rodentolepis nana]
MDDLSVGRTPSIYYDRKIIYHVTSPDGCRYKCNFPKSIDDLGKGDAAVFSNHFSVKKATGLKARGVIIVFESGESPIFMPHLSSEELNQKIYNDASQEMHIWVGDIHEYVSSDTELNFSNGMVPIVLGAYKEDYENVLPPHSYINVDDFDSIQELAEYLQFLDKNDTAYAQYFAWTKHGRIIVNSDSDKMFI